MRATLNDDNAYKYKVIAEFTSGNAMGIITEPLVLDPDLPLESQRMVKIGPKDWDVAMRSPHPKKDFQKVIDLLVDFLRDPKPR